MPILSNKSKELIRESVANNTLPVIGFKVNSSMHDISQSFYSSLIGQSNDTALESFESMGETLLGQDALTELDAVADKMAAKINSALAEIRQVSEESKFLIVREFLYIVKCINNSSICFWQNLFKFSVLTICTLKIIV